MNISDIPYPAFPSMGYAISISQSNGRASVPVAPSAYIYSHFEHVSGVPAPEGVKGVNIDKLKILDTLIGQLSRMKSQPEPPESIEAMEVGTDQGNEKRINDLIVQYQNQIRTTQTANASNPYAAPAPLVGAVFSISV
ncbi:MAG: hypothetical protein LBU85_07655 [Treponema sp.]|nr:hypothetical protein [Treponema sp.]